MTAHKDRAHQALESAIAELRVTERSVNSTLVNRLATVGYRVTAKQVGRWRMGAQPPAGALLALADVFTQGSVDALLQLAGQQPPTLLQQMQRFADDLAAVRSELAGRRAPG